MTDDNEMLEYETEAAEAPEWPVKVCVDGSVTVVSTIPQFLDCYTVVLTAGQKVSELLPQDPLRVSAAICSLDSKVVLCHSWPQTQDAANVTTNLPLPNGAALPQGVYVNVDCIDQMWVAGPATEEVPLRVSVIATRRSPS